MTLRRLFVTLSSLTLALGTPANAQDIPPQRLPVFGGSGGTAFTRDCGSGKVLTGLRFRGGMFVDAVGLLCRVC